MHLLIPQLFLNSKMLLDRLVLFGDLFELLLNTFVMSWLHLRLISFSWFSQPFKFTVTFILSRDIFNL
jgi:hypothetical protein